jgi:hypothetical protein
MSTRMNIRRIRAVVVLAVLVVGLVELPRMLGAAPEGCDSICSN